LIGFSNDFFGIGKFGNDSVGFLSFAFEALIFSSTFTSKTQLKSFPGEVSFALTSSKSPTLAFSLGLINNLIVPSDGPTLFTVKTSVVILGFGFGLGSTGLSF
jgi:hypothetical protein